MATIKGDTPFTVGEGDDAKSYTLLFDFNALCDLEEDFPGIMNGNFEMKSPKAIRKIFAIGLREHHGDIDEVEAGRIIHAYGAEAAGLKMGDAFKAAFPGAKTGSPKAPAAARGGAGSRR